MSEGAHRGQRELTEVRVSSQRSEGAHRGQRELTEVRGSSQRSEGELAVKFLVDNVLPPPCVIAGSILM